MPALEFQINLSGNLTDILGKSAKGLTDTEKHAHSAKKEFELFEGEVGNLRGGFAGLEFNLSALGKGGSLFMFDLATGAREAVALVKELGETFFDLSKDILKAAGKRRTSNLAVKLDVGEEGAAGIDKLAKSFKNTRFDDDQIKESLLPLLEQGVSDPKVLDDLTTAATDIAARRKQGIEGVQSALGAFQKIRAEGRGRPALAARARHQPGRLLQGPRRAARRDRQASRAAYEGREGQIRDAPVGCAQPGGAARRGRARHCDQRGGQDARCHARAPSARAREYVQADSRTARASRQFRGVLINWSR